MASGAAARHVTASETSARSADGPLRVVALLDTVPVSGPGRQLAALAQCLAGRGVELHVVTFHRRGRAPSPYLEYLDRAGVTYSVLEESGPWDARLVIRLRRLLADRAPDIVQTHGYKPTALAYLLRRTGATWPWIAFFHGTTHENLKVRMYHWLDGRMLRAADRVVVMSSLDRERHSHLGQKVGVLYNAAIPLPAHRRDAGVSPAPQPAHDEGIPRIGVVGRLSPEKGVDVFLHAGAELMRRDVPFTAIVAGDGPERASLEHLRDSLGLAPHVRFVGATDDVQSLYASLDLLVIPSRSEGLPNVLLEALRADLPVVATRVGAVPEVLDAPLAGVVVPPGSPSALADGMVEALALKDDGGARTARRAVVERFSVEQRAARHLALYAQLCPQRDPRRRRSPATARPFATTPRFRIEMVLPTLEAAGMEVMAARLASALAIRGYDVGITCLQDGGVLADDLIDKGCRVAVVSAPGFRSNLYAPRLEAWFRALRADVVHVHTGVWLKAARAARRAGAPRVVHTVHGLLDEEPWYGPALKRWAARYTDRIVAVSDPLRDYLARDVRLDPTKIDVILNGVDTDRFRPQPRTGAVRRPLQLREDAVVIGSVARLAPIKNHMLLLEAFAILRERAPETQLVLIGEGPARNALEARARELGLDSSAHFFGAAADVAAIYADLDCFVLASKAEGTSMSILEAMASGVPVVATAVGGTPGLLDDGRCGVLVPSDDAKSLSHALAEFLQDPARLRTLAAAARERVVEHYSERAMLCAYEALYRGDGSSSDAARQQRTAHEQCVG